MGKPNPAEPAPRPRLAEGVKVVANRCPYCHDDVEREDPQTVVCEGCLARHHTDCWTEGNACGACGAARPLSRAQAPKLKRWRPLVALGAAVTLLLPLTLALTRPPEPPPPAPEVRRAAPPSAIELTAGFETASFPEVTGASVSRVWVGTHAWAANLEPGDAIESVDGTPTRTAQAYRRAIAARGLGQIVQLGVRREGTTRVVDLELVALTPPPAVTSPRDLGARLRPYPDGGVVVADVLAGTVAEAATLEPGDRIESVNGAPALTPEALNALLQAAPGGRASLGVRRHYGVTEVVTIVVPGP